MKDLAEAVKGNVDSLPQQETFTDAAAMQQAMENLAGKSLEDLDFPKGSFDRLQDLFEHDNSDVWDAYVGKMANEDSDTGDSVKELDATIRELAEKTDGNTAELDAYISNMGNEQPVPGGLKGAMGTMLLNDAREAMGNMLDSLRQSLDKTGEVSDAQFKEAIDTAADSAAADGNPASQINQDIREHFDLPSDDAADVEVALADPGPHIDIIEADAIDVDDDADDVIDAEVEPYDDIQDDHHTDVTA